MESGSARGAWRIDPDMKKRKEMNEAAMIRVDRETSPMQEWLLGAQAGDERAFEMLVRRFQPMVFKVGFGFFHDRDEALEVLQETFLRVYRHLNRFTHSGGLSPWIYRTAVNICIDHYRSKQKRGERERNLILMHPGSEIDAEVPEEILEKEERQSRLREAVRLLPDRERSVFVLKHFNHLKMKEIARILDISVGTVKSTHFRAMNHLRRVVASGGAQ